MPGKPLKTKCRMTFSTRALHTGTSCAYATSEQSSFGSVTHTQRHATCTQEHAQQCFGAARLTEGFLNCTILATPLSGRKAGAYMSLHTAMIGRHSGCAVFLLFFLTPSMFFLSPAVCCSSSCCSPPLPGDRVQQVHQQRLHAPGNTVNKARSIVDIAMHTDARANLLAVVWAMADGSSRECNVLCHR